MAQKIKLSTKKSWNRPDELITTTNVVFEYLLENKKKITICAAALFFAALLFSGWKFYSHRAESKASHLYYQAIRDYHRINNKKNSAQEGKEAKNLVLSQLKEITEKYPITDSATKAFLYSGHLYYDLKEFDRSIQSYQNFLKKTSKDDPLRILGLDGLAYAYEAKGDYANAIKFFKKIIDEERNPLSEMSHLNAGRCYEELGENDKALDTYQHVLVMYPDSSYSALVKERIKILEKQ